MHLTISCPPPLPPLFASMFTKESAIPCFIGHKVDANSFVGTPISSPYHFTVINRRVAPTTACRSLFTWDEHLGSLAPHFKAWLHLDAALAHALPLKRLALPQLPCHPSCLVCSRAQLLGPPGNASRSTSETAVPRSLCRYNNSGYHLIHMEDILDTGVCKVLHQ